MTDDFKSKQVQTNKIIVTGSFSNQTTNQLLIYNYSAQDSGTPNQGVIDSTKFDTSSIGTDVFLFVSGGVGKRGVAGSNAISVFGGDLHVSGNLTVAGTYPSSGGGGGGGDVYWTSTVSGIVGTTGSIVIDGAGNTISGLWTTVLGSGNTGAGVSILVHGAGNSANANTAHAEGGNTTASGVGSHSEGTSTFALGASSHAEGFSATSLGESSHSEGYESHSGFLGYSITSFIADGGDYAFQLDFSYADITSNITTEFPDQEGNFHTLENVYTYVNASFDGTNTWVTGSGDAPVNPTALTRLFTTPPTSADITIGDTSHSEGYRSFSLGISSHAEGGTDTGIGPISLGNFSHAEGFKTYAKGESSHAEGDRSKALGVYSHAEGNSAISLGSGSHAEGFSTIAIGESSHTEGYFTTGSGNFSHSEGSLTEASGNSSHAEGERTLASGNQSHAEGDSTVASGNHAHAEGDHTLASGNASHAEGYYTTASINIAHAEGAYSQAHGLVSHAEGAYTITFGVSSHAEGSGSIAYGSASHAEGIFTIASGSGQLATGKYNLRNNDFSLFVIGDGTNDDDSNRSDIVRVNSGTLPGSGSFEVTGTIRSTLGFSGSLTQLTDGTPYLIAGTGIQTSTGSSGAVTISLAGTSGLATGKQYVAPYTTTISTTAVLAGQFSWVPADYTGLSSVSVRAIMSTDGTANHTGSLQIYNLTSGSYLDMLDTPSVSTFFVTTSSIPTLLTSSNLLSGITNFDNSSTAIYEVRVSGSSANSTILGGVEIIFS